MTGKEKYWHNYYVIIQISGNMLFAQKLAHEYGENSLTAFHDGAAGITAEALDITCRTMPTKTATPSLTS